MNHHLLISRFNFEKETIDFEKFAMEKQIRISIDYQLRNPERKTFWEFLTRKPSSKQSECLLSLGNDINDCRNEYADKLSFLRMKYNRMHQLCNLIF